MKWSYDESRSKIFESVWDAIKLALLCAEPRAQLYWVFQSEPFAYVTTGASIEAWNNSETADLFETGLADPRELWERPLNPPGPNGGVTVGEDVIEGSPSHANRTRLLIGYGSSGSTPSRFAVTTN